MNRNDAPFNSARALQMIRLLPAPLFAGIAAFAAGKALDIVSPWPEVAGAIAAGYVLGVISRRLNSQ